MSGQWVHTELMDGSLVVLGPMMSVGCPYCNQLCNANISRPPQVEKKCRKVHFLNVCSGARNLLLYYEVHYFGTTECINNGYSGCTQNALPYSLNALDADSGYFWKIYLEHHRQRALQMHVRKAHYRTYRSYYYTKDTLNVLQTY